MVPRKSTPWGQRCNTVLGWCSSSCSHGMRNCSIRVFQLKQVRAGVEVVRGFLLLAWQLKFLSHGALTTMV